LSVAGGGGICARVFSWLVREGGAFGEGGANAVGGGSFDFSRENIEVARVFAGKEIEIVGLGDMSRLSE